MDFFIISRIKEITHLKHDKQIAELINLSPTDFNNRKKIGTLLPLLIDWGIHEKVNLHWLLTGEGDPYVYKEMKDIREVNNEYPAPPDPIDQIMQGFAQLFKDQKKENEKSHDLCNKVLRKFSDLEKKFKKM